MGVVCAFSYSWVCILSVNICTPIQIYTHTHVCVHVCVRVCVCVCACVCEYL